MKFNHGFLFAFLIFLSYVWNTLFAIKFLQTTIYLATSFEFFKLLGLVQLYFLYLLIKEIRILTKSEEKK